MFEFFEFVFLLCRFLLRLRYFLRFFWIGLACWKFGPGDLKSHQKANQTYSLNNKHVDVWATKVTNPERFLHQTIGNTTLNVLGSPAVWTTSAFGPWVGGFIILVPFGCGSKPKIPFFGWFSMVFWVFQVVSRVWMPFWGWIPGHLVVLLKC